MGQIQATRVLRENQKSKKKVNLNRGGTRSSKTYSIVQLAIIWLFKKEPDKKQLVWSICRKSLPSLKATAYRDFREIISDLDLWDFINENLSNLEFSHGNKTIEFFSLDNQQKVRSRKRECLHVCEANEIDFKTFTQLSIRTRYKIYLDWNPDDPFHWIREEIEEKRAAVKGDVKLIVSTYLDNPHLVEDEIAEIEYLKEIDPELWAVFGTGEYGKLTDVIYKNYELEPYPEFVDYQYLGIDWGYSHDPAAVVLVGKSGKNIYLKEIVYETHLLNEQLVDKIKSAELNHLTAVGDSAEPKSIAAVNGLGITCAAAVKGADSIRSGIEAVRGFTLHVDPSSINLLKEIRAYKWSDKKAGVPIDAYNHLLDATRYVITKMFRVGNKVRFTEGVGAVKGFES